MEGPPAPKRLRGPEGGALAVYQEPGDEAAPAGSTISARSSSLPSPTLKLTGHAGSVYQVQYSPNGATLCSASFDKTCLLWSHYNRDELELLDDGGEWENSTNSNNNAATNNNNNNNPTGVATYENFAVLKGHKNAVLDCAWCDSDCVVTASADQTVMLWDAATAARLRKWGSEHTGIVNAVDRVSETAVVSASDDRTCRLWDRRQKRPTAVLQTDFPVLAVAAAEEHQQLYTSGIDPKIYAWDVRQTQHPVYSMAGHTDTVTCLAVHPGPGQPHLLSNSMDQSLRCWDVRPYTDSSSKRHVQTFTGHAHSAEKGLLKCSWSHDNHNTLVSAGSSDGRVHLWDQLSGAELYDLPGHRGCVNAVAFHPVETVVIASGASDKQIYVGELS